jgi:hypothetical protein
MNKEFEQWAEQNYGGVVTKLACEVYYHIQANPHLLHDDGIDGRNNSQYLRQNHSDDTLDMPHTFKVGDWVRVVSNQASMANEKCDRHYFEIGEMVVLKFWCKYSKAWIAKGASDEWYIDPADIEPIK